MATGLKLLGFVRRRRRWRGPLVRGWVHGGLATAWVADRFVRGLATACVSVHTARRRKREPGENKRNKEILGALPPRNAKSRARRGAALAV